MTLLDKTECLNWAYGNLLENAVRGVVAEFIVAKALQIADGNRVEWDSVDLRFEGLTIEVKSSAYLQSWHQDKPSKIIFDIAPRRQLWDASTNSMLVLPTPRRMADVYVFCVFVENNREIANPLDTEQWQFFILSRRVLDERLGHQKTAGLSTIEKLCGPVGFSSVRPSLQALND